MPKPTAGPRRNIPRHAHKTGVPLHFLAGGEMSERIRTFDWAGTPLGPADTWSPALRTMLDILLSNRFPHVLWWGPDYIQFYNDSYMAIPGTKHPDRALGRPASECWSEIWQVLRPLIDTPFNGGPATWDDDIVLEIHRHGFLEETHFTIAYSPVPDETVPGGIGGVLATVHEITEKVVGERRVIALRNLGARATEAKTSDDACAVAAHTLAQDAKDIPFALLYLFDTDGTRARLAGTAGVAPGSRVSPLVLELGTEAHGQSWPMAEVIRTETMQVVEDLADCFGAEVPSGPWSDPPRQAVIVPIRSNVAHQPAGFLVAGVSCRLKLDQLYRSFYELAASQIATAIANARAYEEERKRAEALAELDRAKTAFFSNVSHEFRTPLTLLLGPAEDLLSMKHGILSRGATEHVEIIHRNACRLQKLVNTLLEFSRFEAGRAQAAYVETDLAALTTDLASMFRSTIEQAGLTFTLDCPPLPKPVYVDRGMWEKIVFNLLSNAFKFTLEGEIHVRLRAVAVDGQGLTSATREPFVELSVRDTGIGIAARELPNIFQRFNRIEGRHGRTHEGTGIGLALVQELVKLHVGTIDVESEPDRGTVFHVRVPFGHTHLPAARIGSEPSQPCNALHDQSFVMEASAWLPEETRTAARANTEEPVIAAAADRPRVLVAEDNADMRDYVRRLLQSRYTVEVVQNGAAALAAARRHPPHLILSDVMMPEMNGFELVHALRADETLRATPIIMFSARAGEEACLDGATQGWDDYLTKPFHARELLARVATHLELARVRQTASEGVRRSDHALHESEERLRQTNTELVRRVAEVQNANVEVQQARRAALNLMEDAVQSRQAVERLNRQLLESDSQLRAFTGQLEYLVKERTEELEQSGDRLRALAKDLTVAEQSERRRLATELHDYLAQLLVVVRMKVGQLLGQDQDADMRALLKDADQLLLQSLDYTRSLVSELIPQALYEHGLSAALRWLGDQMRRQRVLNVEIVLDALELPLPEADTVLLFHSVRELLFNVLKHGKTDQASVSMRHAQDVLSITVSDQGCGFDVARLRDDCSDRFGLLSIRERMTALGGGFDLHSAPGKGTVASLHLPLKASGKKIETRGAGEEGRVPSIGVVSGDSPAPNLTLTLPGEANLVTHIRVLIVDDHHLVRDGLRSVLEQYGDIMVIGEASTGEQALQVVCSLNPDVVLMDMQMPGWNGAESTSRLLKERPSTVVIGLSIQSDPHVAQSMLDAGAAAFLTKDAAANELYATLRAAAQRRTASRSLTSCPSAEGLAAGQS